MLALFCSFIAPLLIAFSFPSPVNAQENDGSEKNFSDFGVHFGPLLPSRILGVREVINGWGLRMGTNTGKGFFEIDYFNARGGGVFYQTGSIDYRLDVTSSLINAHFILGGHADYYKPVDPRSNTVAFGWHYGGGIVQEVAGPILMRGDFKFRFSPGTSLYVGIGFVYRFSGSDDGAGSGSGAD